MWPLASRNFRLLVSCNVISVTGSAVANVAIPFAVLGIGGSARDVGYVATAKFTPLILTLLLGGVIADRLPRHQVLFAANLFQAAASGAAAALVLSHRARLWELIVLAAAAGVGVAVSYPAAQGLLPQTVAPDQRAAANALDRTCRNTASIGGAALGGLLVALGGAGLGLAIDAASFLVAGALRFLMRFDATPPAARSRMLADLREGWREFTSRRWLWTIVVQFGFVTTAGSALVSVLGPLVAHASLGGAATWGLLVAGYGLGGVCGGVVMLRFRPGRILLVPLLFVPAFSALFWALAVPLPAAPDIAVSFLAGGCLEVFEVCWATTLQQQIPGDRLSRVSSYDALGNYALTPVAIAVAGGLAGAFGTRAVLVVSGVLIALITVAVLLVPEVRNMRRQEPASSRADR